jgi:peptidylprolyl isomerase
MRRFFVLILACLILTAAAAQKKGRAKYPDGLYAEVNTTKGLLVLQLEFEKTPVAVASFVGLAEGTIENAALPLGQPYYNGSRWHRVVPGHVIQCGMAANSTSGSPGYEYPNEIVAGLSHGAAGMVGVANGGPHTNGSQWYITLGDRSYLDGDYTVFGHVVSGLDHVFQITQEDAIQTVKIVRVGPAANSFRPDTFSFKALVEAKKLSTKEEELKRAEDTEAYIRSQWPDATPFFRQVVKQAGEGPLPKPGDKLRVSYTGQIPGGDFFVSTSDNGKPWYGSAPEPFDFVVGTSRITPGFDAAVAGMRKGEKRVLILPAHQAYGAGGYYPPERKGEKRFHVGPNRIIIYEVEVLDFVR